MRLKKVILESVNRPIGVGLELTKLKKEPKWQIHLT